jgi:hypothetical protein
VVLNDLGALQISLKGKCFTQADMKEEDFSPSAKIKGINVGFRPDASLIKNLRANYQLKRLSSDSMA